MRLLNDLFGIQARGGCACAGPYGHVLLNVDDQTSERYLQCALNHVDGVKPGWTRLNLAPWATDEEVEFLLDAIEFVAEFGERFVALYAFDWESGAWTHPADAAPMELFGDARPRTAAGAVPYASYLREARALAADLSPAGEGGAAARAGGSGVLRPLIRSGGSGSLASGWSGRQGASVRRPQGWNRFAFRGRIRASWTKRLKCLTSVC